MSSRINIFTQPSWRCERVGVEALGTDGGWKPGPGVVPFLSHILHHNPFLCLAQFLRQEDISLNHVHSVDLSLPDLRFVLQFIFIGDSILYIFSQKQNDL